jgi:hypothetical protein
LRERSTVHLFLRDVHRFSVPQLHALSDASLQCSCDHSVVCREVLLLFHLLSVSHCRVEGLLTPTVASSHTLS